MRNSATNRCATPAERPGHPAADLVREADLGLCRVRALRAGMAALRTTRRALIAEGRRLLDALLRAEVRRG
jgi:hypothetical protein